METESNQAIDAPPAGNLAASVKGSSGLIRRFFCAWTWEMAWRDSRTRRGKLLLFACCIVLGVAALTAVGSLGSNLERAIDEQTKTLLGADLVLASQQAFS